MSRRSRIPAAAAWRTALCLRSLVASCVERAGDAAAVDAGSRRSSRSRSAIVEIDGDPRYEPIKAYERLILKTREHPFAGAQVGIDEAKALARVLKTDFALERITVKSPPRSRRPCTQAIDSAGHPVLHHRRAGRSIQAAGRRGARARRAAVQRHRARRLAAPRSVRARDRPCLSEPRHEHGRARAISRVAQMARHPRSARVRAGRRDDDQGIRGLGARSSARASSPTSTSRPAPIRASASRTIRRC